MAFDNPHLSQRKRKRRRREDKPALSARLYLDGTLRGEAGVISEDLAEDLFPQFFVDPAIESVYAAVTPWSPNPSPTASSWTVLPFRRASKDEKQLPPSTLRFPAASQATQSVVNLIQSVSPNRTIRQNVAIEVRISEIVPIALETVFVSIDLGTISKLEEVQRRYGSGFAYANGNTGRRVGKRSLGERPTDDPTTTLEESGRKLISDALKRISVLHTGDLIPLALTHPVTHVAAPPARVLACEPVSQGIILPSTRIVMTSMTERRPTQNLSRPLLSPRLPEHSDDEDDATTETFYSAAEENHNSPAEPIVISKSATDMSNSEDVLDSSAQESELSDDSDDMISLVQPMLTEQSSLIGSALTGATPRLLGARPNGIATPGSVFSNMTATTVRGGQAVRSKVFLTQGLLSRIQDDLLHPRPAVDEDEESRVYVDATALARLGCFSGDWVKIEVSENHMLPQLSAFAQLDSLTVQTWRPVKVYSLPENLAKRHPRYQVNPRGGRRDSISSLPNNPSVMSTLYMSPILLANMGDPRNVSLSPLSTAKRQALKRPLTQRPGSVTLRMPPTATEVTLRKVVTPLANERALNNVLFANLKAYFEGKQRIVKAGDLIAISIDEFIGRSLYAGIPDQDDNNLNALLNHFGKDCQGPNAECAGTNVAWFYVEAVSVPPEEVDAADGTDGWNGAATIDSSQMTMRQSGDDRRKLPSARDNAWPFYMGLQKAPAKAASTSLGSTGLPEVPMQYTSTLQRRLRELLSVSTSPRAIHLGIPPVAILLISTQRNIGKATVVQRACGDLGMHYFPLDAHDIASEGGAGVDIQAQGLLEARFARALDCGPEYTAICIRHIEALGSDRMASSLKDLLTSCRVVVATTTDVDKIPDTVRALFTHELEMSAPDEGEREGILRDIVNCSGTPVAGEVDLASVAVKTAALVAGDLLDVVDRAIVAKSERLQTLSHRASETSGDTVTIKDIQLSGGTSATSLTSADFDAAVDLARKNFADSIGAPKIPNVQWSDVGGLTNVKDAVIETIQLPLSRPELFAKGLKKRSGILFYGPPGTGKTLLAKAIATEFSLNFFSVKGPELLNMYIGESEANVRRVFQRARDARPCVVFFDELDSVAPKRGNQGDSGGVMDRIVSQLLAELDGMSDGEENGGGVFVIGATNRPDLLDQALLRPGRFDKMLYLGISDTHDKQSTILQALTRKFTLHPGLSLPRVAETLPFTFTGADLYALCSDAMLKAITRSAKAVDDRLAVVNADRGKRGLSKASVAYYFDHHATADDLQVQVTEEDFHQAKSELVPSVSVDELQHYERVRAMFEGANANRNGPEMDDAPDSRSATAAAPRPTLKINEAATSRTSGKTAANNNGAVAQPGNYDADDDGDDDDYVIRTEKLKLNGAATGGASRPSSRGKGKGKGKASQESDGRANPIHDADDGTGEDLYD